MNIFILLGHPEKKSLNHAIARACQTQIEKNGHSVFFHDLYKEEFNPLHKFSNTNSESGNEIVEKHISDLTKSDGIIVIHPNWWGQPPAIIKGWIDRILLPGVAYQFVEKNKMNVPVGLLKAKIALIFNTSNAALNVENDPLDSIWKNNIFKFCGVGLVERKNYGEIRESDFEQRTKWITEICSLVNQHFPNIKK